MSDPSKPELVATILDALLRIEELLKTLVEHSRTDG